MMIDSPWQFRQFGWHWKMVNKFMKDFRAKRTYKLPRPLLLLVVGERRVLQQGNDQHRPSGRIEQMLVHQHFLIRQRHLLLRTYSRSLGVQAALIPWRRFLCECILAYDPHETRMVGSETCCLLEPDLQSQKVFAYSIISVWLSLWPFLRFVDRWFLGIIVGEG